MGKNLKVYVAKPRFLISKFDRLLEEIRVGFTQSEHLWFFYPKDMNPNSDFKPGFPNTGVFSMKRSGGKKPPIKNVQFVKNHGMNLQLHVTW